MKTKVTSQHGKILRELSRRRKYHTVADFNGADPECVYIGYKAGTRLNDLEREGLVEIKSKYLRLKGGVGGANWLAGYRLAQGVRLHLGEKYIITLQKQC